MSEPIVCSSALPCEGWRTLERSEPLKRALSGCERAIMQRDNSASHYFPVYNSDLEVVGALEFLLMNTQVNDI